MTAQEKRPIVFMLIDVITFLSYYIIITNVYQEMVSAAGELPFWGGAILLLAPIMIISRIVVYLFFSIINTLISKKREEKFLIDELGEIIRLKAIRNFNNAFMIGFMITMGFLVTGISISVMFKFLFFSIFTAFVVQNISEFYYTRRGL